MNRVVMQNGQWFDADAAKKWTAPVGFYRDGDPIAVETRGERD